MSSCDDPFTVLGVRREASLDEVKRAYRRLAMQWHPDRNPSVAAEAEFRRVHAAYELFLDPQRMAEWQQAQTTMTDAGEPAGTVGDDCVLPLELTLEEAALGCRKDIELVDRVGCRRCCGSGKVQHDHLVPCPRCSGCGRVSRDRGGTSRCTVCAGRGYLRETDCADCAGSGYRQETRKLTVTVPAGLVDGERLRLARQAPVSATSGRETPAAGDLYLEISLTEHSLFVLHGRDLVCEVPVSVFRLLCGGQVEVPTLNGTALLELSSDPGRPFEYRLSGLGFPDRQGRHKGDLVVRLQTVVPDIVGAADAVLLERIEGRQAADLARRAPPLAAWDAQMRTRRQPSTR